MGVGRWDTCILKVVARRRRRERSFWWTYLIAAGDVILKMWQGLNWKICLADQILVDVFSRVRKLEKVRALSKFPNEVHLPRRISHHRRQCHRRALHTATIMSLSTLLIRSLRHRSRALEPWICNSCARATQASSRRGILCPARRSLNTTSESRQNAAPTMEQLRDPFKEKNRTTM